jgi:hypothetical protein
MLYYKTMDKWLMCVVALILGMLMFHMLKGVCGCKVVEGKHHHPRDEALGRLDNVLEPERWYKGVYTKPELGSAYGCEQTWDPESAKWYNSCTDAQKKANERPSAIGPNCHALDSLFGGCAKI